MVGEAVEEPARSGRSFAWPTYFFIANMALLITVGIARAVTGSLHAHPIHQSGAVPIGSSGHGLLIGASLFVVLRAFASGGSALTGTEAISNRVSVFRDPQAGNARTTLTTMTTILGSMFVGVSILAAVVYPVPFRSGTPTVVSQVAKYVYGASPLGHLGFYALQAGTTAILILAANTSFTGFPFLASFAARDSFLPRQLTRRGHRLVFSNGIVVLTLASIALLIATQAKVSSLIALYAIGVFTSFTMAGLGMAKHQLTHKQLPGWQRRLAITATAGVVSLVVDVIFIVTKFTEGAWVVVVLIPLLVLVFMRLHREYQTERAGLRTGAPQAAEAPILRHHTVLLFIDELDMAAARAIQYGRTFSPDEIRAIHFLIDSRHAEQLERDWVHLGLSHLPLEVIDCPDRRLTRAVLEPAARTVADGQTEASILLPRSAYPRIWNRVLHDHTADQLADAVGELDDVNATIIPFRVRSTTAPRSLRLGHPRKPEPSTTELGALTGVSPIAQITPRRQAKVAGRVRSIQVQPWSGVPTLELSIIDTAGNTLTVVFLGRRQIAGVQPGARLSVEGMVGSRSGRPCMLNPIYEILAGAPAPE